MACSAEFVRISASDYEAFLLDQTLVDRVFGYIREENEPHASALREQGRTYFLGSAWQAATIF